MTSAYIKPGAVVLGLMWLAALTGCASGMARLKSEQSQSYVDYAGTPIKQFHSFQLDSWESVARNKLVVWNGVNEAYLITVWDSCRDLEFASRIAVSSTTHSVSTFDSVLVGHERCPISEIRPVDVKQMKAERMAVRAQVGGSDQKPRSQRPH